jgi:hypothetical protein
MYRRFFLVVYRHYLNVYLFTKHKTRGSFVIRHHIFFPHCQTAPESLSMESGLGVGTPGLQDLLTLIWCIFVCSDIEEVMCSECINDLRDIRAASGECLSGDSTETRNLWNCAMKSWKLCWRAWEPHITPGVEITQTSLVSHQELVFGHMLTGTFLFISVRTIHTHTHTHKHWNTVNFFVNILYTPISLRDLLPLYFTLEITHIDTFQQLCLPTVMWVQLTLNNLCRYVQLVETLRYKPEGSEFDSRCCHWNFSLT